MRKIIYLAIVFTLTFFQLSGFVMAAAQSTLNFSPQTVSSATNGSFSTVLRINPGTNKVTAIELYLSFDKNKLTLNSIAASTAFSAVLKAAAIDNTLGTASITVGTPPTAPISAASDVVTLNFKAKTTAGSAVVSVLNTTKAAATGETGNVIISTGYGQATVTVFVPSPSPSPTYNRADIDKNGKVWIEDYNALLTVFGQSNATAGWIGADIVQNGKIDIFDYNFLVGEFGKTS